MESAKPAPWLFPASVYTDQDPKRIFEEAVRSKLLDYLPQEVPYNLSINLEYFETLLDGKIRILFCLFKILLYLYVCLNCM